MKKSLWISPNGEEKEMIPENGNHFSLKELQKAVGGYIETKKTPDGKIMIMNEDGWPKELDINIKASDIMKEPIVGDVLILGSNRLIR